jgi:hypothetical protein
VTYSAFKSETACLEPNFKATIIIKARKAKRKQGERHLSLLKHFILFFQLQQVNNPNRLIFVKIQYSSSSHL